MQTLEAKNLNTDNPLASERITPPVITEKILKPHQIELLEYYRKARESQGFIPFPNRDSVRKDLISSIGRLQISFLLPNGERVGKGAYIGLPNDCKNPKLLGLEYSAKDNGYWLRFTAENNGETQESWVLVSEDKSGKDAIKSFKPHQKEMLDLYRLAKESPGFIPFPNPDLIGNDLISSKGQLQSSFLLPNANGESLGEPLSIGLPEPCKNPKLLGLEYSAKDNGYWLCFTGENEGETQESWVLVSEDKSGREAIKSFKPHQKELLDLYRIAKESKGFIPFTNLDSVRNDLIGTRGQLQVSFLLPNGEQLGDVGSIGLPKDCINPKLHELKYSAKDNGFWIKISGTSKKSGRTRTVEILVSDVPNARGEEAILRTKVLGANLDKAPPLPEEFRRGNSQDKELRKSRGKNLGGASSTVATSTNYNPVTFVKGEAFEQLMGIALALKYPNERVVPQYCLKVGIKDERGFYGMRADYLVGDNKIFEIKWGAATSNIIKTFLRHTDQLKENGEDSYYELIMLLENDDLEKPHTLFSSFVEDLDTEFSSLINKTQELIVQLVENKDHHRLEQVRDYLYSLLIEVKEGDQSSLRLEKLNDRLTLLLINEPKELKDFLTNKTERYFNSLEANFEWKGTLYTANIDPLQYYKEHPESFEVSYTFEAGTGKPFRKLTFATKIDRDLAVAQEVLFGKTQEFPDQEVVIKSPTFDFGGTLICTDPEVASTEGAKFVSSLPELREIVDETRNEKSKLFTDLVGFAEAWVEEKAHIYAA
ncbi:MAG: hypothetical protein NTV65_09195 [Proteobacteria bacterium]|nr:hypothetical protein [Pseudomonadota bacterium]